MDTTAICDIFTSFPLQPFLTGCKGGEFEAGPFAGKERVQGTLALDLRDTREGTFVRSDLQGHRRHPISNLQCQVSRVVPMHWSQA